MQRSFLEKRSSTKVHKINGQNTSSQFLCFASEPPALCRYKKQIWTWILVGIMWFEQESDVWPPDKQNNCLSYQNIVQLSFASISVQHFQARIHRTILQETDTLASHICNRWLRIVSQFPWERRSANHSHSSKAQNKLPEFSFFIHNFLPKRVQDNSDLTWIFPREGASANFRHSRKEQNWGNLTSVMTNDFSHCMYQNSVLTRSLQS